VRYLRVYDRWGGCLYEGLNLPTNDSQFGWSGTYRGKNVSPGVYVYTTQVLYIDGTTEIFSGDVTVVN
ncbi:MAG: gliding motility-associated C-terminal domain-containing protein, partial [Saprospiraceae bacterium]|nr:gliding motility-associated C-terminal domain-containing protein [Saprospiraceae bacterium]